MFPSQLPILDITKKEFFLKFHNDFKDGEMRTVDMYVLKMYIYGLLCPCCPGQESTDQNRLAPDRTRTKKKLKN